MATHTGKLGVVFGVANMQSWSVSETSSPTEFVNSATECATARRPGTKGWSGNYVMNGGDSAVMPGDSFTFTGFTSPDDDTEGQPGYGLTGTALCDSVVFAWDFAGNQPVTTTVNFSNNGALTKDPSMNITASGSLSAPESCQGAIKWDGVDIPDITTASLTIASNSTTYVNSSTNCEERRLGGALTWSASVNVENNLTNIKPLGDYVVLLCEVSGAANDSWSISYMIVKDYTNLSVDRTGAIIGHTIAFEGSAIDETPQLGQILRPGGTVWWPSP